MRDRPNWRRSCPQGQSPGNLLGRTHPHGGLVGSGSDETCGQV